MFCASFTYSGHGPLKILYTNFCRIARGLFIAKQKRMIGEKINF